MANQAGERSSSTWVFVCSAPDAYAELWESMDDKIKQELISNGPIPCEGTLKTGPHCMDCRFGTGELIDEDFFD